MIEKLELTYFDERSQYNKTVLEAEVCDWSLETENQYVDITANGIIDKNDAKNLVDWLVNWINSQV